MLKKFQYFIKILKVSRFKNFKISEKKFIIFDSVSSSEITKLLPKNSYFILETRPSEIKNLYYSKKIITNFLKYYFIDNHKILNAYLLSLIDEIKPKKIITFIDNSFKFFEISKILENKIEFIAIQNAARKDILFHKYEFRKGINKTDLSKKFYIPKFFCFGKHEIDHYKKNKIKVGEFKTIGSLRLMNALEYFKKNKIKIKKNNYDVCLISDDAYGFNKIFKVKNLEKNYALLIKYTIKYCMENKKKLIFAWKRYIKDDHQKEYSYFKKYLTNEEFNYLLNNSQKKSPSTHSSYKSIMESKMVIANISTMLREKLSLKGKILTSNYTSLSYFDFPVNTIFVLKKYKYHDFEKKLSFLLKMSNKEYLKKIKNIGQYIIKYYHKNDLDKLKRKIQCFKLQKHR